MAHRTRIEHDLIGDREVRADAYYANLTGQFAEEHAEEPAEATAP